MSAAKFVEAGRMACSSFVSGMVRSSAATSGEVEDGTSLLLVMVVSAAVAVACADPSSSSMTLFKTEQKDAWEASDGSFSAPAPTEPLLLLKEETEAAAVVCVAQSHQTALARAWGNQCPAGFATAAAPSNSVARTAVRTSSSKLFAATDGDDAGVLLPSPTTTPRRNTACKMCVINVTATSGSSPRHAVNRSVSEGSGSFDLSVGTAAAAAAAARVLVVDDGDVGDGAMIDGG